MIIIRRNTKLYAMCLVNELLVFWGYDLYRTPEWIDTVVKRDLKVEQGIYGHYGFTLGHLIWKRFASTNTFSLTKYAGYPFPDKNDACGLYRAWTTSDLHKVPLIYQTLPCPHTESSIAKELCVVCRWNWRLYITLWDDSFGCYMSKNGNHPVFPREPWPRPPSVESFTDRSHVKAIQFHNYRPAEDTVLGICPKCVGREGQESCDIPGGREGRDTNIAFSGLTGKHKAASTKIKTKLRNDSRKGGTFRASKKLRIGPVNDK